MQAQPILLFCQALRVDLSARVVNSSEHFGDKQGEPDLVKLNSIALDTDHESRVTNGA